jgi:hypothetical protein
VLSGCLEAQTAVLGSNGVLTGLADCHRHQLVGVTRVRCPAPS